MTLAELLPATEDLPAADKLRLIRVLAEELDSGEGISTLQEERQAWSQFGRSSLAKAYGADEPEYTEADLKPGLDS
jgi:hypothetical protein